MFKKTRPKKFTTEEKELQLEMRLTNHMKWMEIAREFKKEHDIDENSMEKFCRRIQKTHQGKKRFRTKRYSISNTGIDYEVEEIICHKTELNEKKYLCKFVGYELNKKTDWVWEKDLCCSSLLIEYKNMLKDL